MPLDAPVTNIVRPRKKIWSGRSIMSRLVIYVETLARKSPHWRLAGAYRLPGYEAVEVCLAPGHRPGWAQEMRPRSVRVDDRLALPLGPTPLDFIFRNLLGGRMLLGFECFHFEDFDLIDGSMV